MFLADSSFIDSVYSILYHLQYTMITRFIKYVTNSLGLATTSLTDSKSCWIQSVSWITTDFIKLNLQEEREGEREREGGKEREGERERVSE